MRTLPDVKLIARAKTPGALRAEHNLTALKVMIRLMPSNERRLVEMVILNRTSHRAAAAALRMVPGVVTRRVRQIRNRLACPVRRALAAHIETLPEPTRGLAIDHFFGGTPRTTLARQYRLSLREVYAELDYVRGWTRALNRRRIDERRRLEMLLAGGTVENGAVTVTSKADDGSDAGSSRRRGIRAVAAIS